MFALKAVFDAARSAATKSAPQARVITPRLETSIGVLYGFHFEYPDGIAIGEALYPVTSTRIEELVKRSKGERADPRALGNDILLLAIVSDRFVDLTSSICCCRPFYYHHRENFFCCSSSIRDLSKLGVVLEPLPQ